MSDSTAATTKKRATTRSKTATAKAAATASGSPARRTSTRRKSQPQIAYDAIAERAYQRFAARGYVHGHDLEDWTSAERELLETAGTARTSTRG